MKYFYSWQEFDKDIEKIIRWAGERNFKNVYGIPRGGLVVGVVLSHRLGLPLKLKMEELDQDTLVVDDIADSGRTLENLDKVLNFKPVVAVLFCHKPRPFAVGQYTLLQSSIEDDQSPRAQGILKERGKDTCRKPDFYIREKKDWVVFPWENEKSSRYDN